MQDITAPTLHSISLDRTLLNIDTGQTTLLVTAHFSDNLSGIFDGQYANGIGGSSPQIRFVSSSGQIVDGMFDIERPVSGDRLDGVYQARITLPASAEAGLWKVEYLLLNDEAGNMDFLSPADTRLLAGTSFTVVNENSDATAPILHSISLNRTSLNIDTGQTTLLVTAHFSDNLSGLSDWSQQIRFVSSSGQIVDGIFDIEHPVSGGQLDGVYQARITLPAYAEAGLWKVDYLLLNDEVGNMTFLSPADTRLLAGTSFRVVNENSDATAPILHSIDLDMTTLDIDAGQTTLLVSAHFSDNLSGLSDWSQQIRFVSSSGQIVDGIFDIEHPVSGGQLDGVYQARITLPAYAEAGLWKVDYLLLNDEVGNMTFLSPADTRLLAGTSFTVGTAGADVLRGTGAAEGFFGRAGNDALDGGSGFDFLNGGSGNDRYALGGGHDSVVDASGTDTITSTISRSLGSYSGIESLTLLGSASISGNGNTLDNAIVGNAGANALNGAAGSDRLNGAGGNDLLNGGAGKDVLTGSVGFDSFVFNTAPNASSNVDRITDFDVSQDTIRLDDAVMPGLGSHVGTLSAANFWKSTSGLAHDADDRIIYETDTGWLNYDSNGGAAGGAVHIAQLNPNLALGYSDFLVI